MNDCILFVPDPESGAFDDGYTMCIACKDWKMTHSETVIRESEKRMVEMFANQYKILHPGKFIKPGRAFINGEEV